MEIGDLVFAAAMGVLVGAIVGGLVAALVLRASIIRLEAELKEEKEYRGSLVGLLACAALSKGGTLSIPMREYGKIPPISVVTVGKVWKVTVAFGDTVTIGASGKAGPS